MSDPKSSAPPAEEIYYAGGSYQQGSNLATVPQPSSTSNDQAYAQHLQNQEYLNAQQQQAAVARPVRPIAAGTQYVAIFPSSTPFDPADLGVAGNFIAPHEARLMEAFSLGKTIRILAILDGLILILDCVYWPALFLLVFWAPLSGWMAATRFSLSWTYSYCCYYVVRICMDLSFIIDGVLWSIVTFVVHLIIARYILRFAKILNSLTPAEIEQLRSPSTVWANFNRRQPEQPFQSL